MNANELADYVDQINTGLAGNTFLPKAATMLRQQQAEIEELKDKLMLAKQSLEIIEGYIK